MLTSNPECYVGSDVSVGGGLKMSLLLGWKVTGEVMMSLESISLLVLREHFPHRCANNPLLATA